MAWLPPLALGTPYAPSTLLGLYFLSPASLLYVLDGQGLALYATVAAVAVFPALVGVQAERDDRDFATWFVATLLFGVVGAAAYVAIGARDGATVADRDGATADRDDATADADRDASDASESGDADRERPPDDDRSDALDAGVRGTKLVLSDGTTLDDRELRAVGEAARYLRDHPDARVVDVCEDRYPDFHCGYATAAGWWEEAVEPGIEELSNVDPPTTDDRGRLFELYADTSTPSPGTVGVVEPDERDVAESEPASDSGTGSASEPIVPDPTSDDERGGASGRSAGPRTPFPHGGLHVDLPSGQTLGPAELTAVGRVSRALDADPEATAAALKRAHFDEHPCGYDDPDEWWTDLVAPGVRALSDRDPPTAGDPSGRTSDASETRDASETSGAASDAEDDAEAGDARERDDPATEFS